MTTQTKSIQYAAAALDDAVSTIIASLGLDVEKHDDVELLCGVRAVYTFHGCRAIDVRSYADLAIRRVWRRNDTYGCTVKLASRNRFTVGINITE